MGDAMQEDVLGAAPVAAQLQAVAEGVAGLPCHTGCTRCKDAYHALCRHHGKLANWPEWSRWVVVTFHKSSKKEVMREQYNDGPGFTNTYGTKQEAQSACDLLWNEHKGDPKGLVKQLFCAVVTHRVDPTLDLESTRDTAVCVLQLTDFVRNTELLQRVQLEYNVRIEAEKANKGQ